MPSQIPRGGWVAWQNNGIGCSSGIRNPLYVLMILFTRTNDRGR